MNKFSRFKIVAAAICLLLNIFCLVWYQFYGYLQNFHSDSATKLILAKEIYETGEYFPRHWYYANNDIFVFFGNLFSLPFIKLLNVSYEMHAVSGLINSLLLFLSVWLVTGITRIDLAQRLFILAAVAGGFSVLMAENIYGQSAYAPMVFFSCFIIAATWNFIEKNSKNHIKWGLLLFCSIFLVFWSNPTRAAVYYIFPLLMGLLIIKYKHFSSVDLKKLWGLMVIVFLSVICGVVAHKIVSSKALMAMGSGNARWLAYEEVLRNASMFPMWVISLLCDLPTKGTKVLDIIGFYSMMRLVGALAVLIITPFVYIKVFRNGLAPIVLIATYALSGLALVLMLQLTTTIPDMTDALQSARYLVPFVFLIVIIAYTYPSTCNNRSIAKLMINFSLFVSIFGILPAYLIQKNESKFSFSSLLNVHNAHQGLADFLKKNNLEYGYATYWNAGVITALSSENVRVRQIVLNDEGYPMPFWHLSSERWYRPSYWTKKSFLLLSKDESKKFDHDRFVYDYGVDSIRSLEYQNYIIYEFGENIANLIPGWNNDFSEAFEYKTNRKSLSKIGKFIPSKGGKKAALISANGEQGLLHFGPYVRLSGGKYTVTFNLTSTGNDAGLVEIASAAGKSYAQSIIYKNNTPIELHFELGEPESIEFKVWVNGNAEVELTGISLQKIQ